MLLKMTLSVHCSAKSGRGRHRCCVAQVRLGAKAVGGSKAPAAMAGCHSVVGEAKALGTFRAAFAEEFM